MDLVNYIGETSSYDKKVRLERHKPKSWLKSVSAFANPKGGVLIWGIDDEDRLVGLDNAKDDSEFISTMIKTKLDPIPRVNLEMLNLSNISSKRRNPMVADVFSRMHLMERRGSGLKKCWISISHKKNMIHLYDQSFVLLKLLFFAVLKNLNYGYAERMAIKNGDKGVISPDIKGNGPDNGDIRPAVKTGDKITMKNEQKKQILVFAEMNLFFKTKDISELLGLQASRARYLL